MRALVWSEVRDLLDVAGVDSIEELITALGDYRAEHPAPTEYAR